MYDLIWINFFLEVFEEIPKPEFKAAPIIPREMKTGCNKKVFFVCNERKS